MTLILRPYQLQAVESVIDYFLAGNKGNPIIAMPTGTGKSLVIAGLIQRVMTSWPKQRLMVLTHVKELIEQNASKLQQLWPNAPVGVYSAGLKQRDTLMPIIFGGAASVVKCVGKFGYRNLLIIDECHLLSPKSNTVYQHIIEELKELNPALKVIGLSATPYRVKQGMLTDGGLFTDVCCDMTGVSAFTRFIAEGHLVPLYPRRMQTTLDVSNVGMSNGDFAANALQDAVDKEEITYRALTELCEAGQDRKSWLIFASGVAHAEHIAEMLRSFGVDAATVTAELSNTERDRRINAFKSGELRCLVNNGVLTTGFDHPPLDLIGMLRPTMSPGLWVQMLGRGTRPSPATQKSDCLVLDFAGNTRRLGPINDPNIPRRGGKGGSGEAPVKLCSDCGTYNHSSVRVCSCCGAEFTFASKLVANAGTEELIRSDLPVIEIFEVSQVFYYLHDKIGSAPQIKVEYHCSGGLQIFREFVQLEHTGFARKRSRDWWRARFEGDYIPDTTAEALDKITQLRVPRTIRVWVNKKYPEVLSHEY